MRTLALMIISASACLAASPAKCYPATSVTSITTLAQYNNAANWSSTSHGTASTCAASGGVAKAIWGNTVTLNAGVPGAAASGDVIDVPADSTIHIPATLYAEFSSSTTVLSDAVHIHGTNSTTRGALIVDAGAAVLLHGASSSGLNFAVIDQYGMICVQPNGYLFEGAYTNGPAIANSGGLYVGRGDQISYPVPAACGTGAAGGWVTASLGATLNLAGTLPSGLAAKDLVELDAVNQPNGTWPYTNTYDGLTPPPNPPLMPKTTDPTTCGTLSTCLVPESTLLCVVAVSGTSVSLGWPAGGNPWQPYCTGAEVAINITDAGSGQLWLKKPAFFGTDPSTITWNNAKTYTPSGVITYYDGIRSGLNIPFGPISNAAGTGPGRPGDTSLSAVWASPASLPACTKLRVTEVTSGTDCFFDPRYGEIVAHGYNITWTSTGSVTYKNATAGGSNGCSTGAAMIPAGARTYNEMIFANAELVNLQGANNFACITFDVLPNTANNRMGVLHSTFRASFGEIGINGGTQDINHPLELNYNVSLNTNVTSAASAAHISFFGPVSYVDISNGKHMGIQALVSPGYVTSSSLVTFDTIRVTNNFAASDDFLGGSWVQATNFSNTWVQDNRIQAYGNNDVGGNFPGYIFAFGGSLGNHSPTGAANKTQFRGNYVYGDYRCAHGYTNFQFSGNVCAFNQHHVTVLSSDYSVEYHTGTYNSGVELDHNLFVTTPLGQSISGTQTGYDGFNLASGYLFHNNTVIGTTYGFMFGDTDGGNSSLLTGIQVYDNILAPDSSGPGLVKSQPIGFAQSSVLFGAGNAAQGSGAFYLGVGGGNPEGIPNPNYYHDATITLAGANYNAIATTRNLTGITVQNPNFLAQKTIALKYAYTSASNATIAMSTDGGLTYGTAVQVNWKTGGTSYTIAASGVSDPGATYDYLQVTTTTSPFATFINPVPASCPVARWAVMLTGANAGTRYGVVNCLAPNQLVFEPHITGITDADTFAILNGEINVCDAAATSCVDIGLLGTLQALPGANATDTGIVVTPSDYCSHAGDCGALGVVSGLPTTLTQGVYNGAAGTNSPLWPVALPELGGSAESAMCAGQAACGGTSYFLPAGSGWQRAGQANGYIGAVAPNPAATVPTGITP